MAVQLNVPDGIEWPVQFRQTFFGATWGFRLRENQLIEDNRASIDVSINGEKIIEGRIVLIGNTIGATIAQSPAVFYALPEGSDLVKPTQVRIRDGSVLLFGSEKDGTSIR